ncbi:MAG: disulfide bond formation protein B [Alphaproteobacteria bacterium]|nr:disulfide bond formation protein B [Alphaproteobacteria bacterium]
MTIDQRTVPAVILAASIAVLGTAFAFQYIGGLQPCVLCIWQRWPYVVTIALAALALALAGRRAAGWAILASGLVFLAGAGIAGFHVGVEQHWWEGTAGCTGAIDLDASAEELGKALLAAPVVRCDEVPWSVFGISMAGYNLILSLALAAGSLYAGRRLLRGGK